MATTAEWKTTVDTDLLTLKTELNDGTKTKEQYNAAVTALIEAGEAVSDPENELRHRVNGKLAVALNLV